LKSSSTPGGRRGEVDHAVDLRQQLVELAGAGQIEVHVRDPGAWRDGLRIKTGSDDVKAAGDQQTLGFLDGAGVHGRPR
jgi:hypothetical protein